MITSTNWPLTRNSLDITSKCVYGKKHSNVNRWVVAVYKVEASTIGDMDCVKLYAIMDKGRPRIWRPNFNEINVYLGSAVNGWKLLRTENKGFYTNDVLAKWGTNQLRHRWDWLVFIWVSARKT